MQELKDLITRSLQLVKQRCQRDGKLNLELLDARQQVSYDLALCCADLAALEAMIEYGDRAADDLASDITAVFRDLTLQRIHGRLYARLGDLDIDPAALHRLFDRFAAQAVSAESMDALGERLIALGLKALPNLLDDEKNMVRDSFARFTDSKVRPLAERIHRDDTDIPDTLITAAAEMGCFGSCIPERFGGLQPDTHPDSLAMIVVTEELSRGSLGAAGSLITRPEIAARALLAGGTDAQQAYWLPRLASGEKLCAISITEPDTGSDVAAVALRATRSESGWLLNGSKTWCTFAGRSELLVVLARTGDAPGHRGLSLFLIEKPAFAGHEFALTQPGGGSLSGRAIPTLGYRGMHSYDLFFEDFLLPDSALLGGEEGQGRGFYYTMAGFAGGRIQTAARATGVMQAAFEAALAYVSERRVFGKALGEFQLTRVKLVHMLAYLTASRQFSYSVARLMDAGKGQMQASLVKLFSCRSAEWVTREAMQLHGGMGYAEESEVSRLFVDARVLSIFEGSEEVLALKVVARELLETV